MLVEFGDGFSPLVGCQMGVAQGHADGAVTQEVAHGVQRYALLNQAGGEVMAQVVPAEARDPGAPQQLSPRGPKSGGDIKNARSRSGLFTPPS